jgi:hypothetical protein
VLSGHGLGVAFSPDTQPEAKDARMSLAQDKSGGKKSRLLFHARRVVAAKRR